MFRFSLRLEFFQLTKGARQLRFFTLSAQWRVILARGFLVPFVGQPGQARKLMSTDNRNKIGELISAAYEQMEEEINTCLLSDRTHSTDDEGKQKILCCRALWPDNLLSFESNHHVTEWADGCQSPCVSWHWFVNITIHCIVLIIMHCFADVLIFRSRCPGRISLIDPSFVKNLGFPQPIY